MVYCPLCGDAIGNNRLLYCVLCQPQEPTVSDHQSIRPFPKLLRNSRIPGSIHHARVMPRITPQHPTKCLPQQAIKDLCKTQATKDLC
jgi:hypothetical protein